MTTSPPRVSVVMTVYRDLRFLDEAVAAVLGQDLRDLELVVVDDGNADPAPFEALARRDPRVRLVTNRTNLGAATSANRGIAASTGPIIARMDADDVAEPSHLRRLVAALDADPGLGLVGSAVTLVDEAGGEHGVVRMPESDLDIRWTILFHNPFYHSAVAYRRAHFDTVGGYRDEERVSQDHYLWHELLPLCRARNLAEPLTRYRLNPQGITAQASGRDPRARTHAIREAEWARLGLTYPLYDDHPAEEITAFLRGQGISQVGLRMAAYEVMLTSLPAFLEASRRRSRFGERASRDRLAVGLMSGMVAQPPARPGRRRRLYELCRAVDPRAARAARAERLLG